MNLKEYIKKNGIKGTHIAKEVGCSPQHLSLMMAGTQGPSLKLAYAIEKYTKGAVDLYSWQEKIEAREKRKEKQTSQPKSDPEVLS